MEDLARQLWETLSQAATGYLPRLAAALAILLGFWLVALILAAATRGALRRTHIDDRIHRWVTGQSGEAEVDSERWVARGVYYLVMLFGLMAFFNALGLLMVADPLNRMLGSIMEYLPRLLSAGLLLGVALLVAMVVRLALTRLLEAARLDERLGESEDAEAAPVAGVSRSIAGAMYWLVLLLFLPLVLDALALEGLLQPLQTMLGQLLGFAPNLLAAALIMAVGWLAARIVRQVVTNLLRAAGVDRLGGATGVDSVVGGQGLSGLAGLLVYALILIPVAIAALDALQLAGISEPAGQMLNTMLQAIPAVLGAALILGIAYLAGRFVAGLARDLLARLGFDNILGHLGLGQAVRPGQATPSQIVGSLVLVVALFFASIEAARRLQMEALADLLVRFAEFGGHVLLGLVIFGFGLYLANLAARVIGASQPPERALLATAARVSILVLAGAMALREMGLAEEIINLAFGLLLGAVAVAAALAFGLGGRDAAARQVERWSSGSRGGGGA